ncbi:hypothetical protein FBFR_11745 [Flavobacterium fryxellicola]|uniref:Uncharacterized protein n=1 Tax=Flavobacterium fryxellicola TaxID=249352 RepID=A0A167WBP0_9FLAO|nr:hypothetical protein FBFR_11745 [Flavobacterium fryxellicola]
MLRIYNFLFFSPPILVFIGIFVSIGAPVKADSTETKFMLRDFKVHDILMKQFPKMDANETIKTAVAVVLGSQSKNFIITKAGIPAGTLNRDPIIMAFTKNGENKFVYNFMDQNLVFPDGNSPLENSF